MDNAISDLKSGSNQIVSIRMCGACGSRHDKVQVVDFVRKNPPWTHWYGCPETGDPVPICIKMHGPNVVEVSNRLTDIMVRAEAAGSFMFMVWFVDPDNPDKLNLDRVRYNLSPDHDATVKRMFLENLGFDIEEIVVRELPPASEPVPSIDLFGDPQ